MKELGVETVVVTNAAGGVNTSFEPGLSYVNFASH